MYSDSYKRWKNTVHLAYSSTGFGIKDMFILYDPKTGKYEKNGSWTDLFRMNSIAVINEHTLVAGYLYPSKEDSIKLIYY